VVRARLAAVAGNALPADEARRAAQAALNGLLARRLKFNLGVKLIAHARRDLAWLEHALRDADAASVPRLAEWAHHLDPERLLDSWADAVDPRHRTGVISKSRGALLRDLQSLRGAVLDWTTVVAPGHGAQDLLLQRQAFEALAATLAREAEDWYDAWGLTGATAQGQLLIVRLAEAVGLGRAIPDDRPQDNDRDGTER